MTQGQTTTVKVRYETKRILAELGKKGDTYDDIISRLIYFYRENGGENVVSTGKQ